MDDYRINPDYGSGTFRRRVGLERKTGVIQVALEDCNHAFRLQLHHRNGLVSELLAETIRAPLTTCGGASDLLREFVGTPLSTTRDELARRHAKRHHCTHLYDLLLMAFWFQCQVDDRVIIDAEVDDAVAGRRSARLHINGALKHEWMLADKAIIRPMLLRGIEPGRGFHKRIARRLPVEQHEPALWLNAALFVAEGRRYDINGMAGQPVMPSRIPLGSCYAYQAERLEKARRSVNSARDFSETADQ